MSKKIFKTMIYLAVAISCLCVGASAAEIQATETGTDGKYTITGTAAANASVVVSVFKNTETEWEKSPLKTVQKEIVFHDQKKADSQGAYEFTVNVQGESGEYVAYLSSGDQFLGSSTFTYREDESVKISVLQNGTEISKIDQLQSGEKITVKASTNKKEEYPNSVLIFVCYNKTASSNYLTHVELKKMEELTDDGSGYVTWEIETNGIPAYNYIKVLAWSDFSTLTPLGGTAISN